MIVCRMGRAATGEGRMRSDLAKDQGEGSEFNLPVGTHVVNVENGTECLPLLMKCSTKERSLVSEVDKAIRLSIRIVIWILPSDTATQPKYQQIVRRQCYLVWRCGIGWNVFGGKWWEDEVDKDSDSRNIICDTWEQQMCTNDHRGEASDHDHHHNRNSSKLGRRWMSSSSFLQPHRQICDQIGWKCGRGSKGGFEPKQFKVEAAQP